MGGEVVVTPGNRRALQVRKVRRGGFTDEKRQVFLDHLAACSNVTRSAAAAGVSVVTVNYHRRRDPVFAQQCEEALAIGYQSLEASMLERAARGGHYEPGPDAEAAPGPESLDTALGLHLLQLRDRPIGRRTGKAGYAPKRASEKELDEAILAQLDVLARRLRSKIGAGRGAGGR